VAQDLDRLQGAWKVTALEVDGQQMPAEMLAGSNIVVQGDRFTSNGMGFVYEGRIGIDASTTPRRLDMKFDAGPEQGNTNPGIYELAGDTWRLCLATRGDVRPAAFGSTPGSGFAVETLVRSAAPARTKPAKSAKAKNARPAEAPATGFDGEWSMLSGIMDGRAMEQSLLQWVERVTKANQTTVVAGPQTMLKVVFTFDPSQSPKAIDYFNLAGTHKGKTQHGIYKLEGDILTVCMAPPGTARPTQFQSVPGDGRTLTAWKRR